LLLSLAYFIANGWALLYSDQIFSFFLSFSFFPFLFKLLEV